MICKRCLMDMTDPEIVFDNNGYCNHCKEAIKRLSQLPKSSKQKLSVLNKYVEVIKSSNTNPNYNCIIGLSGGLDSSYLAYQVKKLGLKPLAIHVDNGWNSELSVRNINNIVSKLNIDFKTIVLNWNSFRDLQLSFLKSSVANCESPTDHAITASLFNEAKKNKIKYILSGGNLSSESIMPKSWGHYNQDLKLLRSIHKQFGTKRLIDYPTISLKQYLFYVLILGIRQVPILNLMDYTKEKSLKVLTKELNFKPYKLKHEESIWTKFFQNYYLPKKFNIDKRKAHLSSLICSNQISRVLAKKILDKPIYNKNEMKKDKAYILKKLKLSEKDFKIIISNKNKSAKDYPSHFFLFEKFEFLKNIFRKIATSI